MKDKYYTPEIEEFHLGFEYEERTGAGWIKQVFNFRDHSPVFGYVETTDPNNSYLYIHNQEDYRVKHLDREDFEDLGFEKKEKQSYMGCETYRKEGIEVIFSPEEMLCSFYLPPFLHYNCKMRGIKTRNKSELKRILKQVGA